MLQRWCPRYTKLISRLQRHPILVGYNAKDAGEDGFDIFRVSDEIGALASYTDFDGPHILGED